MPKNASGKRTTLVNGWKLDDDKKNSTYVGLSATRPSHSVSTGSKIKSVEALRVSVGDKGVKKMQTAPRGYTESAPDRAMTVGPTQMRAAKNASRSLQRDLVKEANSGKSRSMLTAHTSAGASVVSKAEERLPVRANPSNNSAGDARRPDATKKLKK